MIRGAFDGRNPLKGQYTPEEFGKVTIWQMRHLFGYGGAGGTPGRIDARAAFWKRSRILGVSEFEIWRRWADEVAPGLAGRATDNTAGNTAGNTN